MQWVLFAAVLLAGGWIARLGYRRLALGDRTRQAELESTVVAAQRTSDLMDTPGFGPTNPIVVTSAAAIEPRASAVPCPLCQGSLHVQAHAAPPQLGGTLRVLEMKCGRCGERLQLFARVDAATTPD